MIFYSYYAPQVFASVGRSTSENRQIVAYDFGIDRIHRSQDFSASQWGIW